MSRPLNSIKSSNKNKIPLPPSNLQLYQQSSLQMPYFEILQDDMAFNANGIMDKLQIIQKISNNIAMEISQKMNQKIDKVMQYLKEQFEVKMEEQYKEVGYKFDLIQRNQNNFSQFNNKLNMISKNQEVIIKNIDKLAQNRRSNIKSYKSDFILSNPHIRAKQQQSQFILCNPHTKTDPQQSQFLLNNPHNNNLRNDQTNFYLNLQKNIQEQDIFKSKMQLQISPSVLKSIHEDFDHNNSQEDIIQNEDLSDLKNMKWLDPLYEKFKEMEFQFVDYEVLYEYPEMKLINFHQKIDSVNNLILVAELKHNKNIIGAFTANCFKPKNLIPKANPKSFLFNITQNRYVYAHRTNKTHSYDPNYLIFGNWEIKIKSGGNILETTWGSNADSFSRRRFNVEGDLVREHREWLFGGGTNELKEIEIEKYCIFQLKDSI